MNANVVEFETWVRGVAAAKCVTERLRVTLRQSGLVLFNPTIHPYAYNARQQTGSAISKVAKRAKNQLNKGDVICRRTAPHRARSE